MLSFIVGRGEGNDDIGMDSSSMVFFKEGSIMAYDGVVLVILCFDFVKEGVMQCGEDRSVGS
jgi:hypothetical protein